MSWTDETIKRLKKLWSEGHTTSEIGRMIGKSKNAVVGKVHRLNLPPRPSPIRKAGVMPKAVDSSKIASKAPPGAQVSGAAASGGKVKSASCQWPYGHPDDPAFKFCLREVQPGKPYCPEHSQIAYIPANRKGEAREAERRAQLMATAGQKIGWASERSAAPKRAGDPPTIPRMLTAALDEDFSEIVKQDLATAKNKG